MYYSVQRERCTPWSQSPWRLWYMRFSRSPFCCAAETTSPQRDWSISPTARTADRGERMAGRMVRVLPLISTVDLTRITVCSGRLHRRRREGESQPSGSGPSRCTGCLSRWSRSRRSHFRTGRSTPHGPHLRGARVWLSPDSAPC